MALSCHDATLTEQ
jgi:hypothetical protein